MQSLTMYRFHGKGRRFLRFDLLKLYRYRDIPDWAVCHREQVKENSETSPFSEQWRTCDKGSIEVVRRTGP